jgi:hypothetical protein
MGWRSLLEEREKERAEGCDCGGEAAGTLRITKIRSGEQPLADGRAVEFPVTTWPRGGPAARSGAQSEIHGRFRRVKERVVLLDTGPLVSFLADGLVHRDGRTLAGRPFYVHVYRREHRQSEANWANFPVLRLAAEGSM